MNNDQLIVGFLVAEMEWSEPGAPDPFRRVLIDKEGEIYINTKIVNDRKCLEVSGRNNRIFLVLGDYYIAFKTIYRYLGIEYGEDAIDAVEQFVALEAKYRKAVGDRKIDPTIN